MLIQPALSRGKIKKPKAVQPAPVDLSPQGLIGDWKKNYDAAKTANETRYADILGGYQQRYDRGMGNLNLAGAQEASDINQAYQNQQAKVTQNLTSSGLAGTTAAPTLAAGVERNRIADQGRLNERIRQERAATDAGLSGDMLNFKERREDTYPDMGQYTNLLMALGAGGMGGTGTGAPGGIGGVGGTGPGAASAARPLDMNAMRSDYDGYIADWQKKNGGANGQSQMGAYGPDQWNTWLAKNRQKYMNMGLYK